jgi:hypothetical protein
MKDWYRFFGSFIKEKGKLFKEIPMKPPTEQIYYIAFDHKTKPKVDTVNFTLNLKCKNFLENE